jgi:hypothetical protein
MKDEENDITLGKFVESIWCKVGSICDLCNVDHSLHAIEFYHGDGCVKVSTVQMDKLWNMVLITEDER